MLRERPTYRPAYSALIQLLIDDTRFHSAEIEIDKLLNNESTRIGGLMLKARLLDHQGDKTAADTIYNECLNAYPGDQHVIEEASRFYFLNADFERAEQLLQNLIGISPEDASAHHNLGAIRLQQGDYEAAVNSLKQSIEIRPESDETKALLKTAIHAMKADP